ncbi:glutathione S-transferase family protein [Wenzhouxiangella sp. XN79A]|uniref:glutathione S-transferase family protein n=1 Tax=Wenzhouxiangella sp. XN79A TaxID=2724193 RepID=UPI00144A5D1A|nr:glutathione S-transferase family protein [Wenzhouxiangella sp. XN79A]NKI36614.1 glutathione S-transferase family protein [Wenzhouxiangella sp. XN79A]
MSELKLYTHPRSRGRIVRWMLHEVGAEYTTEYLLYGTSMSESAYRQINPMGKVPAIQHGDAIVTECAAICAYLADAFPHNGLAPPTERRADYYRWMFFAAGPVEAAITNAALGVELKPEQEAFVGYGHMQRVLDTLEAAVSRSDYLCGERFTAADVYVASQINFGLQFGTLEKRPAFEGYVRRATDRDAWREADDLDNAAMERHGQAHGS